jgi:hypothetical protein
VSLLLLGAVGLISYAIAFPFSLALFDERAWKQASLFAQGQNADEWYEQCVRGRMVTHLQWRVLRPGMARSAVVALLGRPDQPGIPEELYDLGLCTGGVDHAELFLRYDENGSLIGTRLVPH